LAHAEDRHTQCLPTVDLDGSLDKFVSEAIAVIEKWKTKA
jgi:hypothetical protein